jgi:hypothetical protein
MLIASAVKMIADHAGPDDLVFVAISAHGAPGLLAQKIGSRNLPPIPAAGLQHIFAPLAGHRTIFVMSACYSGSLISSIAANDRVIVTAARWDRTSFGCAPDAGHTVFGQALLNAFAVPNQSLQTIFIHTADEVANVEVQRHFSPPSQPMVAIGKDMVGLYQQPFL